jgi:hypothetical protein
VGELTFDLGNQTIRASVTANVKDWKTIAVEWKGIRVTDVRKKEFKLEGYVDWTWVE